MPGVGVSLMKETKENKQILKDVGLLMKMEKWATTLYHKANEVFW